MAQEIYGLSARVRAAGQHAECIFSYRIDNPTNPDEFAVAEQLVEATQLGGAPTWLTRFRNCLSEDVEITSLRARRITQGGGNTAVGVSAAGAFPGTIVSDVNTQQIAAVINWIPATAGRDMGRNFIPGIPKSALVGSRWEAAYVAIIDLFIVKHLTGFSIAAGVFVPCVFKRLDSTNSLVNEGYLSPKVGTQRRREVPL